MNILVVYHSNIYSERVPSLSRSAGSKAISAFRGSILHGNVDGSLIGIDRLCSLSLPYFITLLSLDALVEVNGKQSGVKVDSPSHFIGRQSIGSTTM